jgi:hypothetical protein
MPERSALTQVVQIGVEAVSGTPVPANKRFQTMGIEPTPAVAIDQFRPAGTKYRHMTALNKEWVTAPMSGKGSYTEIVYPLSSWVTSPVITAAGTSFEWVFSPQTSLEDNPKTFTIEHGSSVRSDRIDNAIFNDFGMTFSRDAVDISGALFGRAMEDPFPLTPGATSVDLKPILPGHVSVYMDEDAASLGTTKLHRLTNANFTGSGRRAPLWVVDAALSSYATNIETEPTVSLSLTLEADAEGMALLTTMHNGDRKFVRVECIGGLIDATVPYSLILDFSGEITGTGGFSDQGGLYAIEWTFTAIHDATWGKAYEFTVVNGQATL